MTWNKRQRRRTMALSALALGLVAAGAYAFVSTTWVEPAEAAPPNEPPKPKPKPKKKVVKKKAKPPRIDVVFALDTTGSMSGLIEGAKRKIWAIADKIVSGQPRPDVRVGLIGYRDKGDDYITKTYALTRDMDSVYEHLRGFEAAGGGDGPEHVNRALADAIRKMQWEQGDKVLKLIFLVGDAPPHDDYDDGLHSIALAKEARSNGILINAVRCGSDAEAEEAWKEIAVAAAGRYATIAQDGGMVATATPYDDKLKKLNADLAGSVMAYGSGGRKARAKKKAKRRMAMDAPAAASAASFSAKSGRFDSDDLLTALGDGTIAFEALAKDELPEEAQAMAPAKRKTWLEEKRTARDALNARILEVTKERDKWLADNEEEDTKDAFDGKFMDMLKEQAAPMGLSY